MIRSRLTVGYVCSMIFATIPILAADEIPAGRVVPTRILVPAYFYPAGEGLRTWNRMIDSHDPAQGIEIVAIANINSGNVGTRLDPNYADVIQRAAKKGVTVIGYVSSDYANSHGMAPLETVKTNVSNWLKLHPELKGIFVDEQSSDAKEIAGYYEPLRTHINSIRPGLFVVGNPGTDCSEDYVAQRADGPVMDVVVIHENNETKLPYATAAPKEWTSKYPSDRFAMLVHTSNSFGRQLRLAKTRRTAYVFVTDAVGPPPDTIHPWGKLPTYWDDELQMIGAINEFQRGRP